MHFHPLCFSNAAQEADPFLGEKLRLDAVGQGDAIDSMDSSMVDGCDLLIKQVDGRHIPTFSEIAWCSCDILPQDAAVESYLMALWGDQHDFSSALGLTHG